MNVHMHGPRRPTLFLPLALAPRRREADGRRLERGPATHSGSLSPAELARIVSDIIG